VHYLIQSLQSRDDDVRVHNILINGGGAQDRGKTSAIFIFFDNNAQDEGNRLCIFYKSRDKI